jgi:hypothetical protein
MSSKNPGGTERQRRRTKLSRIRWERIQKLASGKETDKGTREEHGRGNLARILGKGPEPMGPKSPGSIFMRWPEGEKRACVLVMGGN